MTTFCESPGRAPTETLQKTNLVLGEEEDGASRARDAATGGRCRNRRSRKYFGQEKRRGSTRRPTDFDTTPGSRSQVRSRALRRARGDSAGTPRSPRRGVRTCDGRASSADRALRRGYRLRGRVGRERRPCPSDPHFPNVRPGVVRSAETWSAVARESGASTAARLHARGTALDKGAGRARPPPPGPP